MKKTLLLSALLLASLSVTFVACKKADPEKTRKELIVGNWNLTKESADTNKNNQLDSIVVLPFFSVGETHEGTFNADGSGNWNDYYGPGSSTGKIDFSWSFNDGDKNLRIINQYTLPGSDGNPIPLLDTNNYVITTLTQTNLEFYVEEKDGNISLKWYTRK